MAVLQPPVQSLGGDGEDCWGLWLLLLAGKLSQLLLTLPTLGWQHLVAGGRLLAGRLLVPEPCIH